MRPVPSGWSRSRRPSGSRKQATTGFCRSVRSVAARIADAGIGVVTLPQTNLFLQARDHPTAPPRGLTAIRALRNAGAEVAGGGDNVSDPFNLVGRADPLETAALLVMAAHLMPIDAYDAVSRIARSVLGLVPGGIEVGAPAELLAIEAPTLRAAVAGASPNRTVWHRGRRVASTTTTVELADPSP